MYDPVINWIKTKEELNDPDKKADENDEAPANKLKSPKSPNNENASEKVFSGDLEDISLLKPERLDGQPRSAPNIIDVGVKSPIEATRKKSDAEDLNNIENKEDINARYVFILNSCSFIVRYVFYFSSSFFL